MKKEISLKGLETKIANMKFSKFRTSLLDQCRDCFQKFFDKEEKKKHAKILSKIIDKQSLTTQEREKYLSDFEKATIFQTKLFGNMEFVGELYRRKILQDGTLKSIFDQLLGMPNSGQ